MDTNTNQVNPTDGLGGAREHLISRRTAVGRVAGLSAVAALTGAGLDPRRASLSALGQARTAQEQPAVAAANVVLVHGAYADGSCWSEVIGRLQDAGLNVTSVQNPLTSLADDVAATQRALALQDGPTVLVGHSWAGTVISEGG
jgi:pimeloyl-ACP methyl ester carboxylesterase